MIYVDNMRAPFGRLILCHMIADTEDELHAMADRIGVARKWYQGDHYDIALSKRALAVSFGAIEINRIQCGFMAMLKRMGKPMGTPETAKERYIALMQGRRARTVA
jgi:hypothetical protein